MLGKPNNRLLAGYCQPHDQFLRSIGPHLAKDKQTAFADFPERFAVEVAGLSGDVMVLSSEHCHSQLTNATSLMVMRDLLSPHFSEIRIVCYFRELAAVAKSFYSTAIKGGISASFAEFLNNCTPKSLRYSAGAGSGRYWSGFVTLARPCKYCFDALKQRLT